jgi:hypothetical protein
MDIRQAIIKLAAKLRKEYPQEDGRYAIVRMTPQQTAFDEGFQGDPLEDNRPDFVKKDDEGWQRIGIYKGER